MAKFPNGYCGFTLKSMKIENNEFVLYFELNKKSWQYEKMKLRLGFILFLKFIFKTITQISFLAYRSIYA
jgi:hypothetical protein